MDVVAGVGFSELVAWKSIPGDTSAAGSGSQSLYSEKWTLRKAKIGASAEGDRGQSREGISTPGIAMSHAGWHNASKRLRS
jgi:hypothetical protein